MREVLCVCVCLCGEYFTAADDRENSDFKTA